MVVIRMRGGNIRVVVAVEGGVVVKEEVGKEEVVSFVILLVSFCIVLFLFLVCKEVLLVCCGRPFLETFV